MSLESILMNCHDVYSMECTDEYESIVGMVGKDKYRFTLLSYPARILEIESEDNKVIYNDDPEYIKSVTPIYDNNVIISLLLKVRTDKRKYNITLGITNPTGLKPY